VPLSRNDYYLRRLLSDVSEEFKSILETIEVEQKSVFITGKAGTGKSTLLRLLRSTSKRRLAVVAPTGIAALNVKGQTIHSFFKFPPKMLADQDIKKLRSHKFYKKLQVLVIDEISMVRADMMDNIDLFLRRNREINEPFGGVQLVVFGDLFQLPPVIAGPVERELLSRRYKSPYFFSSRVLKRELNLHMIEMTKVYRQQEMRFINMLDDIRIRDIDYELFEELNARYIPDFEPEELYITLCSVNKTVHAINKENLEALDEEIFYYNASINGDFKENLFPTDFTLNLKLGAQVMFVKNDIEKNYVNGTIAKIIHLESNKITVKILDHNTGEYKNLDIEPQEWEIHRYELDAKDQTRFKTKVVGTFKQYPIKLAWAITIHKSQGKTFDRVIIDLGSGAFEFGQTYVALSRCRTLEGIVLKNKIKPQDIKVDFRVQAYYDYKRQYW